MDEYKISLGVDVDTSDIRTQINRAIGNAQFKKVEIELNKKKIDSQLNSIRKQIQNLSNIKVNLNINPNIGGNNTSRNNQFNNSAQKAGKQAGQIISTAAQKAIKDVSSKEINMPFKVAKSSSTKFKNEMDNLVKQWTKGKGNIVDLKVDTKTVYDEASQKHVEKLHRAQVTYNNELGETIKKTIAWKQIGTRTNADGSKTAIEGFVEVASQYSKAIDKTKAKTNNFVNQQKQAVSNLTNQINQLNKAANDQNAPKAIKDTSHLNELSSKYNDIIVAIQRMGNASSDVFIDEKINVEKLISEYKILVREFKNAESVATSLRSKDIDTVKNTYNSKLDVLISKMRKDGVYTSGFEKGAENLRSVLSNATDASGLTKFLNGLDKLDAGYKRASASAKEFNQSQKVGIKTSGLESKIADIQRISPEIDKFEANINGAKVTVRSLLAELSQVKTQGDFTVVNSKFKAFTDAAKAAGIAVTETATKIKSVNEIRIKLADTGFDGFEQELQRAHAEANQLENSTVDLELALKRLDVAMESINTADEANDVKALVSANEEYENALKQVYSQLKLIQQVQNADNNLISLNQARDNLSLDIDNWLKENSAAAKNFGGRLREIQSNIHDADRTKLSHLRAEFKNVTKEAQLTGKTTQTFGDKLKAQFSRYFNYLGVASAFMYVEQGQRDMFKQVVAIDTAMTELKKVTDETDATYNKFLTNAASRAKEIGTTIDGLVTSTADFARLGYGFKDSQKLAEVANIYAVVGDEIDGVEDATQSLVSTLAAFKSEMNGMSDSDFAMSIVDKMNEVSNNFAISSGGIGQALQRSASSMAAANNSLDETIAMITAANTVAQNPEKVGKGCADLKNGYIG